MQTTLQTDSEPIDWSKLYREVEQQGEVPYAASETIGKAQANIQAMYLDLGDIKKKITESGFDPPLVTVYADVLHIPDETSWFLRNAVLMLVARRITIDGKATVSLDYRSGPAASLVVFANAIEGAIHAVVATEHEPVCFLISAAPPSGGVHIHWLNGAPVETALSRAQGLAMQPGKAFEQFLREFIFASLLYDQRPAIALDQLIWLKDWSGASPELLGMFLRSSSLATLLASQINARENGSAFVPYLTQQLYTELASRFVEEANQYESDYRLLSLQKSLNDDGIKLAQTLCDNQTYQSEYVTKLLERARMNYENAVAAVDAARRNFDDADLKAQLVKIDLEEKGVKDWQRKKIVDAVIQLGTAAITFATGIAAMLASGGGAGGGEAAKSAIDGVKAVEEAAKTGSETVQLAKELREVMEKLKKIVEALKKVYEFSKRVMAAASDIKRAQTYAAEMRKMDLDTGGVDLSAAFEWQIYLLRADAAIADPVAKGIEYAQELKLAIEAVAIYGQALAAAQVAAVRAGQDYACLLLQKELAELQQERLKEYVGSLKVNEPPITAMMQEFYQRYLDTKSALFSAIVAYRAAFFYWALEPSKVSPRVTQTVEKIDTDRKMLTAMALDRESALEHFDPPPQDLVNTRAVIEEDAVLDRLRKKGPAVWSVGLETPAFADLARVRLSTVRMWIEGAKPGPSGQITLRMETAGNYLDRFGSTLYQFTSKPLKRGFRYRVSKKREGRAPDFEFEDGTFGYIEIDGKVDDEVSYAYFEPTPFTTWTLGVKGEDVDLSGVTRITMEFSGSVIAQSGTRRVELAERAARYYGAAGGRDA